MSLVVQGLTFTTAGWLVSSVGIRQLIYGHQTPFRESFNFHLNRIGGASLRPSRYCFEGHRVTCTRVTRGIFSGDIPTPIEEAATNVAFFFQSAEHLCGS
jgi:hypothetical protein